MRGTQHPISQQRPILWLLLSLGCVVAMGMALLLIARQPFDDNSPMAKLLSARATVYAGAFLGSVLAGVSLMRREALWWAGFGLLVLHIFCLFYVPSVVEALTTFYYRYLA